MIYKQIATLGPIGYLPAPGTCATTCGLLLVYCAHWLQISTVAYVSAIVLFVVCAWYVVARAQSAFAANDPKEIVIDEVIGILITFIAVPVSWVTVLTGFVLFRFFDISKFPFISHLEKKQNVFSILADDIAAGIYSLVLLHVALSYHLI